MLESARGPAPAPKPSIANCIVDPEAPPTEQATGPKPEDKLGEAQPESKGARSCRLKYPVLCVLALAGLGGLVGLGLEVSHPGTFSHALEEAAG